jgi:hypothetical protein
MDEIRKKLDDNATLPIWPDVAELFGLCRASAYAAAAKGDIKTSGWAGCCGSRPHGCARSSIWRARHEQTGAP